VVGYIKKKSIAWGLNPRQLKKYIWEFRTRYDGLQIRLLAFWDKTDGVETLVLATHGFIKKVEKYPQMKLIGR